MFVTEDDEAYYEEIVERSGDGMDNADAAAQPRDAPGGKGFPPPCHWIRA